VKLAIAEKETDEDDEENPIKYLATNKIDAPPEHVIRSYAIRWRIETFFEDSKQDLGLGDCEMQTDEGASRHWHLLMAATVSFVLILSRAPWGRFARRRHRFERTSNIP
jgi:SRSO17 transposase